MNIQQEIVTWLHTRPDWQQEAVVRALTSQEICDSDLDQLAGLCKTEAGQIKTKSRTFLELCSGVAQYQSLHMISIGDICGIENLQPRNPLSFGMGNLVVVYGNNGSGKSGYVRILKKACGKHPENDLRSNIFSGLPDKRCCRIQYKIGDLIVTRNWLANEEPIAELLPLDIFDTDNGRIYLSTENAVSYVPRAVAIFDDLVRVCEGVKVRLQKEKEALISKLPIIPTEYTLTETANLFKNLRAHHTEVDLTSILVWDEANKKKLSELEDRLKTDDPARLAVTKRRQKVQIDGIYQNITSAIVVLSPESSLNIIQLKISAKNKRQIAIEGATEALKSASLDGVGSETWRALWEAARRYSMEKAYPSTDFPKTIDGTRCVLCQQPLLADGQQRLNEFEAYVKGEIEAAAATAEAQFQAAIQSLPLVQSDEALRTVCQASGLEDDWIQRLLSFWNAVAYTKSQLVGTVTAANIEGLRQEQFQWMEDLQMLCLKLETQAKQHEADAQSFNRAKATQEKVELQAKRWASQQAESIKSELQRLKTVAQYDEWIRGTDHTAISRKAGDIAEKVITGAYTDRFNAEIERLGAKRIKVEMVKTRASQGRALHGIRLRSITADGVSPVNILSEGEKRIVELAAFLADVTGGPNKAPFVFDDPISSLDQDFEEKTIDRLIELSAERQVIIFTHRLSFLGILNDKSKPNTVCIRHESWGAGEPGDVPLFGNRPDSALRKLLDERLPQAEKKLYHSGTESYYPLAKAICSDLRILIERIIELDFFADIIQRHRRAVKTQGKIGKLAIIKASDCSIVDTFMTKYSRYEHSQSSEAPVDVPQPDELRADINAILEWHRDLIKRQEGAV